MYAGIWQDLAEVDYRRERIAADFGLPGSRVRRAGLRPRRHWPALLHRTARDAGGR